MKKHLIPAQEMETELRVANSRFISSIKPVFSREDAESYLQDIRGRYPDATHHVPAYLVGHGASVLAHTSDDGEPSGTAGRPALAVLKGSGLGDTALVITRYFGGTKLGTGGLVKAYGDAARKAIQAVPKAEKIRVNLVKIILAYPFYDQVTQRLSVQGGIIKDQEFTSHVEIFCQLPADNMDTYQQMLNEITSGQAELIVVERDQSAFLPLSDRSQKEAGGKK